MIFTHVALHRDTTFSS